MHRRDHIIATGFIAGALIMTLVLRICLMRENHRREHLSIADRNREASIEEPCDWVNIEHIYMGVEKTLHNILAS